MKKFMFGLAILASITFTNNVNGQCSGGQCYGGQCGGQYGGNSGWGDATSYRIPEYQQQPATPILYPTPVRKFLFGSHVGVPASTSIPTCPACGSPNCICGPDCKCQPGYECKNGKCIPKQKVEFKLSLVQ